MDATQLAISIAVGASGGFLGGLFGIGGGVVIIPLLTMAFGSNPHLYQASSLVAALMVSGGSIPRHIRARAIRWDFALRTIPFSLALVGAGVALGNALENPHWIERIFAAFLVYVAVAEVVHHIRPGACSNDAAPIPARAGWKPAAIVGGAMGSLSGLLGIGGGVIAVPLMRVVNRFDIRTTIATSALLVLPTVITAAALKFATLSSVKAPDSPDGAPGAPITPASALWLALALAPGAYFGAAAGASLVHKVPMRRLSMMFAALCAFLALRMAGLWGS